MPGPGPPGTGTGAKIPGNIGTAQKNTTSCRYRTALLNRVVLQNKECKRAAIVCASKMKTDRIPGNVKIDWSTATEQLEARYFSITQVEQLPGRNLTLQWWCGCSGFGGCGVVCGVWLCWLTQVGPNGAQCYHNFSYLCSSPRLSLESPPDYYRHYDNRDDHHADSDRDRHNYADDH